MKKFATILTIIFFISTGKINAQEKLFCKSWKMDYSTKNGIRETLTEADKSEKVTLFMDHTMEGGSDDEMTKGKWKLNDEKNMLLLDIDGAPTSFELKIIKITETELVLEKANEDDGSVKTVYLIPVI